MCDHTAWGVNVVKEVNSPNVKLLYDIYHMQIMEGDLIATIRDNIKWLGHFHTGGVPGRHELGRHPGSELRRNRARHFGDGLPRLCRHGVFADTHGQARVAEAGHRNLHAVVPVKLIKAK
jgi:sugar phosphate isomerase/epimerase